jgi:hypothetical protein
MRRWLIALAFPLLTSCSSDPRSISIEVTLGHETGAFGAAPAVTSVVVRALDANEAVVASTTSEPGGTFELGEFPLTELVSIEVEGRDAVGERRVRGRSFSLVLGELASDVLPVFAQRVGEFARPPSELEETHVRGATAVLGERYLLVTGGSGEDAARATFYDLVSLGPATGGTLPRVAETLLPAANGGAMLVVGPRPDAPDGPRGATWVDFETGELTDISPPEGLASFDEVAGGAAITGANGASYVVGATRSSAPSDAVLVVTADRSVAVVRLETARRGASATWVEGPGLVVAGGSSEGSGVETLAATGTRFAPRPFSADGVTGAAAVATGNADEVLLVGGVDGSAPAATRRFAANCTSRCAPTVLAPTGLAAATTRCHAYVVGPGVTLVVCEDATSGETRVRRIMNGGVTVEEVPLRERRLRATPLPTPVGTLAILGGVAPDDASAVKTIELWSPP